MYLDRASAVGRGVLFTARHSPRGFSGIGRLLPREDTLAYVRRAAMSLMGHAIAPEHR